MSETASTPSTALSVDSTLAAEVPPHLWLRSGRPLLGTATRVYLTVVLIATALIFVPQGPVYWGLIGGGVLCYVLFPVVIQGLLKPIERRVLTVRRREATGLLQEVRGRRLVRQFAPHAWLTLQEGRLHLRRGDGKAAARAFTETVRLSRGAGEPALVSAQAQALLIAEQPEQTRELLQALAKKGPLSASDRLHLGLALLAGKGNGRDALEHVQAAAQTLGGHPRVLAALALALHRVDETSEALVMLQRAQDALGEEPDPFDEALVQRGVKLLRTVQKAQQKRERKVEPATARVAGAVVAKPVKETKGEAKGEAKTVEEKAKSVRRVKKDERRAARRAAKAEKRTQPESAKAKKVKAAKVKPAGKVVGGGVKGVETPGVKVVEAPGVKPVEAKAETPVAKAETPVAKAVEAPVVKAVEAKAETPVAKAVEAKAEAPVAKAVEAPVAKIVEAKAETPAAKVVETPVAKVVEATAETPVAKVVEAPVVKTAEAKVVEAPKASEVPVAARPVMAAPVGARPAPPAGTALFGSLGAPGASRAVSGPQAGVPGLGLPRAPLGASGEAVPRTMSGEVTAPAPKAASGVPTAPVPRVMSTTPGALPPRPPAPSVASNPIVRPAVPTVTSNPIVRPAAPTAARPAVPSLPLSPVRPPVPVIGGAPSVTPAAVVSAAPAPVQAAPRVVAAPAPVLPPRPAAPVLPPAPVAVVLPTAPVAAAGPARPSELAQVLPDTDDAWDDMLNALEADGPSSP